jgi:TonB family protein
MTLVLRRALDPIALGNFFKQNLMRMYLFLLASLLLSGCQDVIYTQEGAATEGPKSVKITCQSGWDEGGISPQYQRMIVMAIDGKSTEREVLLYPNIVYVTPGWHDLKVQCHLGAIETDGHVTLTAQAGKSYVIREKTVGYGPVIWAEEAGTGKVVDNEPAPTDHGVDRPPQALLEPTPEYPLEAKKRGIQGDVVITFVVDTDGRVRNAQIISSPDPLLSNAVLAVIPQCRFQPGIKNGVPVNCRMSVPIHFALTDAR